MSRILQKRRRKKGQFKKSHVQNTINRSPFGQLVSFSKTQI